MSLRDEATRLLEATALESALRVFGKPKIGGSYSYDLLVDRDIDIDVWLPNGKELSYELRAKFAATMLRQIHQMRGLSVADVYHFPNGAKHAVDGIWFGLDILSDVSGERWNIDVWLMKHDGKNEANGELTERLHHLTEEERTVILAIKREALKRGEKEKGSTSVDIYQAVLNDGVSTYSEFLEYIGRQ